MLQMYERLQDRQQFSLNQNAGRITDDPQRALDAHRRLLDAAHAGDWVTFADRLAAHQRETHAE